MLQVRSPDLADAVARDLVTWPAPAPAIDPLAGTLSPAGTLADDAALFNPLDSDGPAFAAEPIHD